MRTPLDRLTQRLPNPARVALDWILTLAIAVAVVLTVKVEVANPYRIPSASMEPTLRCARPTAGCDGTFSDRVIANRLAYRFILKPQGASYVDFFSLPPYLWLGAICFAVAVSILAALYPAARAARIDPVRALRHD